MMGPCTYGTDNQTDRNFKSVPILLSLFTGLKTLFIKSVTWHFLIDSERGLCMNMHRNLWLGGVLVLPQAPGEKKDSYASL